MKKTQIDEDILEGLIDIHIHSAPEVGPRLLNEINAVSSARDAGR